MGLRVSSAVICCYRRGLTIHRSSFYCTPCSAIEQSGERLIIPDGYHLSELNFPVASLTCLPSAANPSTSFLPTCLGLDANRYSLVTAIFTVGGLVGSLGSSWLVQKQGLKGGLVYVGWMNVLGVVLMALSPNWLVLALGR